MVTQGEYSYFDVYDGKIADLLKCYFILCGNCVGVGEYKTLRNICPGGKNRLTSLRPILKLFVWLL